MKKNLLIALALAAVGGMCLLGITESRDAFVVDGNTHRESIYTTNSVYTITSTAGTEFLTISNRPYVQFGEVGGFILRVTDAEWQAITNHYSAKLQTNLLIFYCNEAHDHRR